MAQLMILTVCSGNIHRSVIAEYALRQALEKKELGKVIEVVSRGLAGMPGVDPLKRKNIIDYPDEWAMTAPTLERLGLDVREHQSQPLDGAIVSRASLILAMDKRVMVRHPHSLVKVFPQAMYKVRLYAELDGDVGDIQDPYGSRDEALFRSITERIHNIAHRRLNSAVAFARLFNSIVE